VEYELLKKRVAEINWFHRIDLGQGIVTTGRKRGQERLARLVLPSSFSGLTVLDIGAWDGYFSFEAERRGATRVLATDSFCWGGGGPTTKAGFELAREALGSKVEDLEIDVMDLSPERVGTFDVVLFLGVLYHMIHPMRALEKVYGVTGKQLILETEVDMLHVRRPALAFYPGREAWNDPTNWFGPNPAAAVAMVKTVGFREVKVVDGPRPLRVRFARAVGRRLRRHDPFTFASLQRSRMALHAWR
jgi:tRNA (mo5U34)-methyltransferase